MKKYKFTVSLILGILVSSCSLQEEPPFLKNIDVYDSSNNAEAALAGMYESVATNGYYGSQFISLANLNSGFAVTKRGGNNNNNADNSTLCSLKPTSGSTQLINSWQAIYASIARSNDCIKSSNVTENSSNIDELVINEVVGQAYFLRAFNYFNLVRMYGEVPLRTDPTNIETVHLAKSSINEVYAQIISDAENAKSLMTGVIESATVKQGAINMLLAKVYMTLATAPSEQQEPGLNYWQMAYDEAEMVYGSHSLHSDYDDLFRVTGNNSIEAIFELQYSEEASNDHMRSFTPVFYTVGKTFGQLQANYEVYDLHAETYLDDPRLSTTYISSWSRTDKEMLYKTYPTIKTRVNFAKGFPFVLKLGARDQSHTVRVTNKNFKVYRYADLLLMLAEISNELQNGEALGYVTEVLDRVGLTPHAGYTGDQESFRNAIMKEYQFELIFEGHDWFNNRRRGYNYFLNNVIIPHNTVLKENVDVVLDDNEKNIMYLPFPQSEIDANELID